MNKMHTITMGDITPEFANCWQCAGKHINAQIQGGLKTWLKAELMPPFLEHLSFRLENQLFFVRIFDINNGISIPGTVSGLKAVAKGCGGYACLMPMKKSNGNWIPEKPNWGLIDLDTNESVNPHTLVTNKNVVMTQWELHDFAVQVVRDQLRKEGFRIMSWQGNPNIDPSLWFIGKTSSPEWIIVREAQFPQQEAPRPMNLTAIAAKCLELGKVGHFASVSFMNCNTQSANNPLPLYRGHGMHIRYVGLQQI